jgi:hypothetical protein
VIVGSVAFGKFHGFDHSSCKKKVKQGELAQKKKETMLTHPNIDKKH